MLKVGVTRDWKSVADVEQWREGPLRGQARGLAVHRMAVCHRAMQRDRGALS